ncbi:MAG: sulfatase-like hydrolase/transferase [Deltaproteobacteria bacterium]|nr:sulfatase-like hydrolase/transferase [Deltaproteobacteria bacterium]
MLLRPPSRRALLGGGLAALGAAGCRPGADPSRPGGDPPPPTAPPTRPPLGAPAARTRPNIILVYADQHRGDVVGALGNAAAQTPNLDRLVREGVAFDRAFTNAPSCRPARFAMMQRRYPTQTGVWDNRQSNTPDSPSHVRQIRDEANYHTMVIGKTHLYDGDHHTDQYRGLLQEWGFTDSIEMLGPTEQKLRPSTYSDWLTANTPEGETDKYTRWIAYADNYSWLGPPPDDAPYDLASGDHQDIYTGSIAADWIRQYADTRPFYLQLNFPGPHKPFDSTSEYRARFDGVALPAPILVDPVDASSLVRQMLGIKAEVWDPVTAAFLIQTYYAKIAMVDAALGLVIAALEETGQLDDTWILYHSDHGEMLSDHMLTGKVVFYESSIHVPLVIRPPGGAAPWVCHGLTDTLDVIRTIVDLSGLDSEDALAPGVSLLGKVLAGPDAPEAQTHKDEVLSSNISSTMIRTATHKLVLDRAYAPALVTDLFDLVNDPDELTNLRFDPAVRPTIDDLVARLAAADLAYPLLDSELGSDTG